jgi:hypothetical protein
MPSSGRHFRFCYLKNAVQTVLGIRASEIFILKVRPIKQRVHENLGRVPSCQGYGLPAKTDVLHANFMCMLNVFRACRALSRTLSLYHLDY